MKKKVFMLLSILLVGILTISNVNAVTIAEAGESVKQEGEYESTRFIAGNNVKNKATVNGLSFAAGNEVEIEGTDEYGFYAGNNIYVRGTIQKDLFIAGNNIVLEKDAVISRDVYIAGNTIEIETNIARDLRVAATSVDISGVTINGDVYLSSKDIRLDKDTVITGKLSYPENAEIKGLDEATVGKIKKMKSIDFNFEKPFKVKAITFCISLVASIITLIVLLFMLPKAKEKLNKLELNASEIIKSLCIGLASLICIPIAAIIALFTGVLTPVAVITLIVYGISIYLSNLLLCYVVGNLITTKLFKKENTYLAIVCGVVVVKLLELIPFVGLFISFIGLLYGLGLIFKFIKQRGIEK